MSRHLPVRPNLDFLKKEAKALLDELRRGDPSRQLADAQFALARDYGFASWPVLKAHVEALGAEAVSPLAGGWIADVARSKRHPANLFRSARIHFTVTGRTIDIVHEYVDESGKAERGRNRIEADGVERDTGSGYAIAASWADANTLRTTAKKDGQVAGGAAYVVSADGRTLTITDDDGDSVIVLDRLLQ
ncbi:MAG TPA: hypothetical protein VEA16_01940 [Vicinamibacterales bacterium]|nr:hypothetical protein [Vicinamibacterales bacterium]